METLSVAIIGDHLRMHYRSLSVFYGKESKEFKQAMKVINKRNEQKLDLTTFQYISFTEEDFEEEKLGINLQKVNEKTVKMQEKIQPAISEPLKEKVLKKIEEEKEKAPEKDKGVLELTKAIIDVPEDDEEHPEELLHKEIEELTKPVVKEGFFGKVFGKLKLFAGAAK